MIAYILIDNGILLGADIDRNTIEKMVTNDNQRIAEIEITNKRLSIPLEAYNNEQTQHDEGTNLLLEA